MGQAVVTYNQTLVTYDVLKVKMSFLHARIQMKCVKTENITFKVFSTEIIVGKQKRVKHKILKKFSGCLIYGYKTQGPQFQTSLIWTLISY